MVPVPVWCGVWAVNHTLPLDTMQCCLFFPFHSFIHSCSQQGAWHSWEREGNLSWNLTPRSSRKVEGALSSH